MLHFILIIINKARARFILKFLQVSVSLFVSKAYLNFGEILPSFNLITWGILLLK